MSEIILLRRWSISFAPKTKREHRVPLCGRAQEILEEARTLEDGAAQLIFTREGGMPLGAGRLRKLLRRNGIAAVPQGFRSSFRDWAAVVVLPAGFGIWRSSRLSGTRT